MRQCWNAYPVFASYRGASIPLVCRQQESGGLGADRLRQWRLNALHQHTIPPVITEGLDIAQHGDMQGVPPRRIGMKEVVLNPPMRGIKAHRTAIAKNINKGIGSRCLPKNRDPIQGRGFPLKPEIIVIKIAAEGAMIRLINLHYGCMSQIIIWLAGVIADIRTRRNAQLIAHNRIIQPGLDPNVVGLAGA
ncbi:hypothetical protein Hgul01_05139 [Herpetosiphon gulosus]|uniref:Uncharacterized protein n=1 Tax=Herpetosiphon gulosus TaxID=1973496 RepID=A0ABP9X7E0_9CHLR